MIRLAHVVDTFHDAFLAQYGPRLRGEQLQALAALRRCRAPHSAHFQIACTDCGHQRLVPHSCGHRLCPHCQHHESQQWIERQLQKRLPVRYFLITFTLPAQLRPIARSHCTDVFEALLSTAWDTVRTFSQNHPQLQGTPGAIAVLHTHSRALAFHPHVHLLLPAAAVDLQHKRWRSKPAGQHARVYLFNAKALAKVFRAKMFHALNRLGLALPVAAPTDWVVHCKHVGSGEKTLVYLGRYLYRGVIREQDILACENGTVRFQFKNAKTQRFEQRTVPGPDFLWLILQHTLPKGFRRAREYGLLHPNAKRLIALVQVLLRFVPRPITEFIKPRPTLSCPCCGAVMKIVRTRIRHPNFYPVHPPNVSQANA